MNIRVVTSYSFNIWRRTHFLYESHVLQSHTTYNRNFFLELLICCYFIYTHIKMNVLSNFELFS